MISSPSASGLTYADAGVVDASQQGSAQTPLLELIQSTFDFRKGLGRPLLPLGLFANVLELGNGLGLAISTDGVGTKILIAQMMDKYDTIGIDCVAMNVNDIICVGAEPVALTDYIAVQVAEADLLTELARGICEGAQRSGISIPGGEIAQVPEMMHGTREGNGFDLVGTCVGLVPTDRILVGQDIDDGDVIVGLASSGIHSNGLTMARRALLDRRGLKIDTYVPEFGRTAGEELLQPTEIYVRFALACLQARLPVKSFVHITSDGFLNLTRAQAEMGYIIDELLDVPPVFDLIQHCGGVSDEEMFRVYNMGVGFCAVVSPDAVETILGLAHDCGYQSRVIGRTFSDPDRTVRIVPRRLEGKHGVFRSY